MWTVRMTERKLLMTHPELSLADSNLAKQEQKMQNAHSHKMMMINIIINIIYLPDTFIQISLQCTQCT